MMLIEFTGVPGSGKTYLCGIMADMLRDHGLAVSTPLDGLAGMSPLIRIPRKFARIALFGLAHAVHSLRLYYTIARTGQSSVLDTVRSLATILFVLSEIDTHRRRDGILLLDQGVAQSVFTVFYAATSEIDCTDFNGLPVPDLLVEVDAGDSQVRERLEGRLGRQSRVERDGNDGVARARTAMERMRKTGFYALIPRKESLVNEGSTENGGIECALDAIVKRILHDK